MKTLTRKELAGMIDHTLLSVEASRTAVEELCREAEREGFASVCIHPYWLEEMRPHFPKLKFCTVIGFPLGLQTVKMHEAQKAVQAGAVELDIVINYSWVAEKKWSAIEEELKSFRQVFQDIGLKLIVETCRLKSEEIIKLCQLASDANFEWIKTSTGFAASGAKREDVALMKAHAGSRMGVKASGGVRDLKAAQEMIDAGATRIGTSSGIAILREFDSLHRS